MAEPLRWFSGRIRRGQQRVRPHRRTGRGGPYPLLPRGCRSVARIGVRILTVRGRRPPGRGRYQNGTHSGRSRDGGDGLYAEERQQAILACARGKGRVDVVSLAEQFTVTTETIRRDLNVLERAGTLRRVHGGAIPLERLGFEPALAARDAVMTSEKER